MTAVKDNKTAPIHNDNFKNLKPFTNKKGETVTPKTKPENPAPEVSNNAKNLKTEDAKKPETPTLSTAAEATSKATDIAEGLAKVPVLPIVVPKKENNISKKLDEPVKERIHYIKKPAVIFIEGFSAFGISNGDGIRDMAENFPGAKRFDWEDKDKIIEEIRKHSPEQPVVLVGHSFGGDTAVEVANELNSAKNAFRQVDLLVSLDSVGFKNDIIPMNVKRNLNFFQEGVIPFLHGSPNIARNTDYTEVVNELRNELHSKIDDSPEVQYKIFESINDVLSDNHPEEDIVIEMSLKDFIGSQLSSLKKE